MRQPVPVEQPVRPVLRPHDVAEVHRPGRDDDPDDDQAQRHLIGNHLRRRPQRPQERVFGVARPAPHDDPVNLQRRNREDEQDRHVDVRQHQIVAERDHRPGQHRQHEGQHRGQEEHELVRARRHDDFLDDVFQRIRDGLEKPPGPDDVRPATHLHGGPDLPVAVNEEQKADHHEGDDHQALRHDDQGHAQGCRQKLGHRRPLSPRLPCGNALFRAIGHRHFRVDGPQPVGQVRRDRVNSIRAPNATLFRHFRADLPHKSKAL